jgi:hypothetical protein
MDGRGMRLGLPDMIDNIPITHITAFDCSTIANQVRIIIIIIFFNSQTIQYKYIYIIRFMNIISIKNNP